MEGLQKESQQQKLPIFKYKDQVIKSIEQESAVIISGLTGCGKSTQVPQYLLDSFPEARIAVCEPRRLAATSLAIRVCEQRQKKLGHEVGYQIGLQTKRSQKTRLVYMTYGILIQELLFRESLDYDFIILDQVHERSLEMDFAFVILKKIINQNLREKTFYQKENKEIKQENTIKEANKTESQQQHRPPTSLFTKRENNSLKLIIMSATLNSDQFQKYFAVHRITKLIIEPEILINYSEQQSGRRRGSRNPQRRRGNLDYERASDPKKEISINYVNLSEYKQGVCIFIDEKSPYTVKQYFLQDILPYFNEKVPVKNYDNRTQVRLDEKHFDWGVRLIEKVYRDIEYVVKNSLSNIQRQKQSDLSGDILVFLPGLLQITRMKQTLTRASTIYTQKIVQVHSLFSQQLYFKLFKSQIKNKIILATNIGESSITLPNCKVVIDYCLNRKAVKNSQEGISRFTTTVASLSNLTQRKGRVGRVSDGSVYRMITKEELNELPEFDVPQIKCVSLEMSILKTKKLQSTSKSHIFEDVYDIFLNVLEPPQISSIETAIENLIHEDALEYVEEHNIDDSKSQIRKRDERRKINSGKKYDGKKLKITKVGEFMVSMPCDLGVSKLILMGIKLGISSVVIDMAAIILSTKNFFVHEQKIFNIEQFMHSVIGYDKGDNNDYLLRQRLYDHWRSRFYIPFRDKQRQKQSKNEKKTSIIGSEISFRMFDFGEQVEFDQNYKIVDNFVRKNESQEQRIFCKNRGVYANHMRQLLRMSETLKIRIQLIGVQKSKLNTFQPQSELVLICLMYAFPDLICQVSFQAKKRQLSHYLEQKDHYSNRVHIPLIQGLDERELDKYLDPQRDYDVKQHKDSIMVSSYDHVLKKFLFPKHFTKASIDKCSLLFKHCRNSKITYPYQYNIHYGFSSVTVFNESINKEILIPKHILSHDHIEKLYMISNNVIESKGRYMVGANALISQLQLVIISMIVKKNVQVCLHPSGEFFSYMKLNQKKLEIPLLLTQTQLALINKLRALSKRKKQQEIASYKQQFDKDQLKILSHLFKFDNVKQNEQDWEQLFIQEESNVNSKEHQSFYQYIEDKWIPIEYAEKKIKKAQGKSYYQRYNEWKKYLYESSERQLKLFGTTEPILICGHCNAKQKFVEVASAFSFDFNTAHLKLNRYSGSWICPDSKSQQIDRAGLKIYCSNMHQVGTSIDSDFASMDLKNIYLYIPFNQVYNLCKIQSRQQYAQLLTQAKFQSLKALKYQYEKFDKYECKICYTKEAQRKLFIRSELEQKREKKGNAIKDPLWGAIISHASSVQHINSKQKLKNSIR